MEKELKELQTLATKHLTEAEYPGLRVGPETRLGMIYAKIIRLTESYPNGFTEGIIGSLTYNINQLDEDLRAPFEEIRDRLTPLPPRELSLKEKNFAIIQYIEDMTGMGWETQEDFDKVMREIDRAFMGYTGPAVSKRRIGGCGVDAGCLIIIDPCYLKYLPDSDKDEDWQKWCDDIIGPQTSSPELGGPVSYGGGGVIVSTGGDGKFPVYMYYDEDGCVTKIEIIIRKGE